MKYLLLLFFLIGCTTTSKYDPGQCLMIVDKPSGETVSPYRVKVEGVTFNDDETYTYTYRWWLDEQGWAQSTSETCTEQEAQEIRCLTTQALERISDPVNLCPIELSCNIVCCQAEIPSCIKCREEQARCQ